MLQPQARAVMAELRKSPAGAPMKHDLRAMLDAIGYLTALASGSCAAGSMRAD